MIRSVLGLLLTVVFLLALPAQGLAQIDAAVPVGEPEKGGSYELTPDGGGSSQTLTATTSTGGYVTAFALNGITYTWDSERRNYQNLGGGGAASYYVFTDSGDGTYGYYKMAPTIPSHTVLEQGKCTPN